MKYEDIAKANATIRTTDIKGKEYAEVNQRIKAFRMCNPEGTITTDIVSLENGVVLMKSTVMDADGKIIGTGYAYEKESSSFINNTSYIENCETSAVGRALGMCGFGIDTSVASAEEVTNAINNQGKPAEKPKKEEPAVAKPDFRQLLRDFCKAQKINMNEIAAKYNIGRNSTQDDFERVCTEIGAINAERKN